MRMLRRATTAVLAAGAVVCGSTRAQGAPSSGDPLVETRRLCQAASATVSDAPALAAVAGPTVDFVELLRTQAQAALQYACRRLPDGWPGDLATGLERLLDVGEAAVDTGRFDAAGAVLEALRRAVDTAAAGAGLGGESLARLSLVQARLADERADSRLAGEHFARARAALESAGLTWSRRFAAVLVGEASGLRHFRPAGGLQRADELLDRAAALLSALGLAVSFEMADVLNERTLVRYALGDLPGTVDVARQEVAMLRVLGLGDSPHRLHAQITLGGVLSQLGRQTEAEVELREAMRLTELHPTVSPAGALGTLNNLAALYLDLGRPAQALAINDRAVAVAVTAFGAGTLRSLNPLNTRGRVLLLLARYGEAREAFEQALVIATVHRASVGSLRRLRLQDDLAEALAAVGETAAARELVQQGLQETVSTDGLGYWRGRMLRRRAAMAARDGDWPAADAGLAQAMPLVGAVIGERNPWVIDMLAKRCYAQAAAPLPGTACSELATAVDAPGSTAPGYRFNMLAALAKDDERNGRTDAALLRHLQALAAAESAGTPDPLWPAYAALATHLRARGLKATSVLMAKQAVEQIERMRALLGADLRRLERGFLSDKLVVYRRLADWLTEDGRVDEALDVIRLLKEEEFLDFVNRDGGQYGRPESGPSYSDREGEARSRWRSRADGAAAGTADEVAAMLRREAEFVSRWRELLDQQAGVADAAPSGAATRTAARRVAPPAGELWVWLYPGDRRVNLVIDSPARRIVTAVDAAAADVTRLLGAVERREPVFDQLAALHALIGVPIERAAAADGARRIVFMADGVLRYLPFAALHDGRRYLGERYAVEHRVPLPAAGAAAFAAARRGKSQVMAMGVTRSLAGMSPLSKVANEICGIVDGPVQGLARDDAACGANGAGRGVMRGRGWMNDAFTEERLRVQVAAARQPAAAPRRTSILHIGTHFVLRPGRMTRSWLLLGDGGQLSLESLGKLDFSGQSLVTLSACETGLGGALGGGSGEEIDGLGGLMLRRGAGAVVASLWRVEDASTSVLMQGFYRQLAAGAAPADALRRAQTDVRSAGGRTAHPFYWAGFYLVTGMS